MADDTKSQARVLCVGHCTLDTIGVVPRFAPPDTKAELHEFAIQGGGAAATTAVALAHLGVPTRFVGKVGDDDRGNAIRRTLAHMDVDVSSMVVQPGEVSQFSHIIVESMTGRRQSYWTQGSVARMDQDDVANVSVEGYELVHVDGEQPVAQLALARRAKAAGIPVSFDAGDLDSDNRLLVAETDVLIASERFASEFTGFGDLEEAIEAIRGQGPHTVIVTLGAEGSVGRDSKGRHFQGPIRLAEERDTIGAGDVYRGAYIFAMLQKQPMAECMAFATAAASLSLRNLGGRSSLPSLTEIEALLKKSEV